MPTLLVDDGFQHANTTAGGAGSTTGVPTTPATGAANGWIDINGSVASINSNTLKMTTDAGTINTNFWSRDYLTRSAETSQNPRLRVYFLYTGSGTSAFPLAILRYTGQANNRYLVYATGTQLSAAWVSGAAVLTQIGTPVTATLTSGHYYCLQAAIAGSTITTSLYDLGTALPAQTGTEPTLGTALATYTASDTTIAAATGQTFGVNVNSNNAANNAMTVTRFVAEDTTPVVLQPNNASITYSPYNWIVSAASAETVNPGAYFSLLFTGTAITLAFDTTNGFAGSGFWIRVDGGSWVYNTLTSSLPVTGLANGQHLFELVFSGVNTTSNRWNAAQRTAIIMTSITLDSGATVAAINKAPYNILIYGDSITEGLNTRGTASTVATDDALPAWSYSLRELLGCEVGVVGFGGQGWDWAGTGNVPIFPSAYNLIRSGVNRVFTPTPNLIIIAHGENDFLNSTPTATVAANVTTVITALKAVSKVLVITPLSGGYKSTIQPAASAAGATVIDASTVLIAPPSVDYETDNIHPVAAASRGKYGPWVAEQVVTLGLLSGATIPAAVNVRSGVATGNTTGTLVVPAASQVVAGVIFDNGTVGTVVVPATSDVRSGVAVGSGHGTLVVPTPSTVVIDTIYDNGTVGLFLRDYPAIPVWTISGDMHAGDVGRPLNLQLFEDDGTTPLNVSTATVIFSLYDPTGNVSTRTAAFITDGTDGKVGYLTVANDLTVGNWQIQATATFTDGTVWHSDRYGFRVNSNL
jgi:GDSL-like Lipase/Acylhydrolase family